MILFLDRTTFDENNFSQESFKINMVAKIFDITRSTQKLLVSFYFFSMKRKKRTRPTKSSRKIISKDERDKVARFQRIWILFDQILPRCKNFLSTFNLDENSIRRGIIFSKRLLQIFLRFEFQLY